MTRIATAGFVSLAALASPAVAWAQLSPSAESAAHGNFTPEERTKIFVTLQQFLAVHKLGIAR
jgi:hypothetical protein